MHQGKEGTVKTAIPDLVYRSRVLNPMGLDQTAKIQVRLGEWYRNKEAALKRFIWVFCCLDPIIWNRLVVEK